MKHISQTLEAAQNELATSSTKSHGEISNRTVLPNSWVSALFKKFQARYLHKWTSAIEGIEQIAVDEWASKLGGLTGEQIKFGLASWDWDWPPSADEFKKCCLNKKLNEFGLDYIPECYRTPIIDRSRLLSSDAREADREAGKQHIGALLNELKGKATVKRSDHV